MPEGYGFAGCIKNLTYNADGYRSVLAGGPQYESYEARDRAIEAAAARPLGQIIETLRAAQDALVAAFEAETDFGRTVQMLVRPTQPGLMTLGRRREIEVHHLDLDLGRSPNEIDAGYVERDTAMLTVWWEAKNGMTLPATIASEPTLDRWLWLVGRTELDGEDRAGLF